MRNRVMVRNGGMARNAPHSGVAPAELMTELGQLTGHPQRTFAFHCSVKAPGSGSLGCHLPFHVCWGTAEQTGL